MSQSETISRQNHWSLSTVLGVVLYVLQLNLKKYSTVGTFQKVNRKITERIKIDDPNAQIHD